MVHEFVSVITPTYNRRKFLPMLIHLYKNQTYPKESRELIILDDSPTSNEDLIPTDFPNIRYYHQSERMNLGEKRNKLNELAKGEIIVCFDDDDYQYPERIAHSVFKLNQSKKNLAGCTLLDIYYTDTNKIYRFGPYGANHATNGTFAYRKSYALKHKHDDTKTKQEEPSFTNNFTEDLVQLTTNKVILCISHDSNTTDKKKMLKPTTLENNCDLRKKFKHDKVYLQFLLGLHNEINK